MTSNLKVWVLNAEEGDSIVLDYTEEGRRAVGVIDSNRNKQGNIPAVQKLKELGVTKLNFVLLTHPHADHYTGMTELLDTYQPNQIYSYPLGLQLADPRGLDALKKLYLEYTQNPNDFIQKSALEFIGLLTIARRRKQFWEEQHGPESRLRLDGFGSNVVCTVVAPFLKEKGQYLQMVEGEDPRAIHGTNLNNLSVALRIEFGGHTVLLGADTTLKIWQEVGKRVEKEDIVFGSSFVKVPHHGSAHDSQAKVLDLLYGLKGDESSQDGDRIALISAVGNSHHPADEILDYLSAQNVKPYCTNLSNKCRGSLRHMPLPTEYEPELARFLRLNDVDGAFAKKQPCQGDICVNLADDGTYQITTQHDVPCPYRGEYAFLE